MFCNLEAELARRGLSKKELALCLGCTPSTLSMKLNGKSPISLYEAAKIKAILGTDIPLEILFES